jgi:D-proline reductase (dithiol) PrdB
MHIEYMKRIGQLYDSLGYPPYNWVVNEDTPPWQALEKPLSESRLCLLASGGIYVTGQEAFHYKDDTSYRGVPRNVKTEDLRATHFAYDLTAARSDPNTVFPIDTLRKLAAEGFIGGLTAHAYTFMGGIYSSRRVREELAPRLVKQMLVEGADLALLVPC